MTWPPGCRSPAEALHDGIIDAYKAQVIAEATRCLDAAAAAEAEAAIVPDRVMGKTPGQIRALIARAVLKADPGAARQRREQAQKDARVELWREDAGTAAIVSFGLPPDEALAADQQITSRAMDLKAAGVPGSMDALRVRAYLDALLGQDTAARYQTTPSQPSSSPSDGSSSNCPSSSPGSDHARSDSPGSDHARSSSPGSDHARSGNPRAVTTPCSSSPGSDHARSDSPGSDHAGSSSPGSDHARSSDNPAGDHAGSSSPGGGCSSSPGGGYPGGPGGGCPGGRGGGRPGGRGGGPDGEPGAPAGNSTPGGSPAPGQPRGTGPGGPAPAPVRAAAKINLTIPLATLLGLAEHPGEATGFGPVDAALARTLAAQAAGHPATSWCVTVTDPDGHPLAHGCARNGRRTRKPGRRTRPPAPGGQPSGGTAPPGGYRTWRLRPGLLGTASGTGPAGLPELTADLEPIPVADCDHRHQAAAHDPSPALRHLVEIRDGTCTWPPCQRHAARCDYDHTTAFENGGLTCACNGGPRCRHHHHQKQAAGWRLEQSQPGYHTWTTPAGRRYTSGPTTYPI